MHNRGLYEKFDDEQLFIIVHDSWSKWMEALTHEFNYGTDNVVALMYESIPSILLMDREDLLDRIGLMDKYIYKLNKHNE
jgi:tryptophan 2,3-dioxygenase